MSKAPIRSLYYVLRRLLETVPLVIGVVAISFTLIHMAPGDPASLLAGEFADASAVESLRHEFGLDQPLFVQFLTYLQKVFTADLGYSYRYRASVLDLVMSRLPNTLLLLVVAFVTSLVVGIVLALFAATKPNSLLDNTISGVGTIGYCLPMFWSGMMLILLFSSMLQWLPTGGMYSLKADHTGFGAVLDVGRHLLLPAVTYAAYFAAISFQLTRSKVIDTLREDFIKTAHAKGLSENEVLFGHALRNSLVPVVAVMGLNFGVMIGGSVTVETVFSWPGVGRLMYDSILSRDYPLLLGIFVIVSIGVIIANLIADLITAAIDPRIVYD